MTLTICYLTNRIEPHFEWFTESLRRQTNGRANVEVICIDFFADQPKRRKFFEMTAKNIEVFKHVTPKPSVWQGYHKLTRNEYFAAANARNTGFAMCRTTHIAFVDDLTVLVPGWLDQVYHCMANNYVMAGAYKKVFGMRVNEGVLYHFIETKRGTDSRWARGSDSGITPIEGSCLYGCSFALPLQAALDVNGQDEIYDSLGGEDWDFGMRLERKGYKIFYNRNALTYESEEGHADSNFVDKQSRVDKPLGGSYSSNHLLNRLLNEDRERSWTIGNRFNLAEQRTEVLKHGPGAFVIPTEPKNHWVDGHPLSDM